MNLRTRILLATGACLAAAAALTALVRVRSADAWREMQTLAAATAARCDARGDARPPLCGERRPGNAFEHYLQGVELVREQGDRFDEEFVDLLALADAELATKIADERPTWQPMLAALRAGARCEAARFPVPETVSEESVADILASASLCKLAIFEARALRHAGRGREAVEWTLDAAALGADYTHGGILINQMIGIALLTVATDEAWPDGALQQLDPEGLALLAVGLRRLDERLDPCLGLDDEIAFMGKLLQSADADAELFAGTSLQAWSYGFSSRWMAADAFLQITACAAELDAERGSWPARKALMEDLAERCDGTDNPFLAMLVPNLLGAEENLRQVVAQVRMLRVAVALHRGEQLELADPFAAGPLTVTTDGDGHRIVSAGEREGAPLTRAVAAR